MDAELEPESSQMPSVPAATLMEELASVDRALRRLLEREPLPGLVRPEYLREAVEAYPNRGGKRLRPALTLWFCGLVGGRPAAAAHAALAVELYHNWTLVHDDIIDRDTTRRGLPTCHVLLSQRAAQVLSLADASQFGVHMAMLVGDIQHGWAVNALSRAAQDGVPLDIVNALVSRLSGWVTPRLIAGEALDLEYVFRHDLSPSAVEEMLALKTAVLLRFAAEAGVMIGVSTAEAEHPTVRAAARVAEEAGLAFQLHDDLLGMFGDEPRMGKPVGSDLREGKRTVLLLRTLATVEEPDRRFLTSVLGRADLTAADLARTRDLMVRCGAVHELQQRAAALAASARHGLDAFPDNRYRELLDAWVAFLVDRNR
jgi:geranylgeranyl diphosphate synthase type I